MLPYNISVLLQLMVYHLRSSKNFHFFWACWFSFEVLVHVEMCCSANVLEEHSAYIFRVKVCMANKFGYVCRWLIWPKGGKENLGIELSLTLEMEATYPPKHQ